MKISIGNDHAGPDYKKAIVEYLEEKDTPFTTMEPILLKV